MNDQKYRVQKPNWEKSKSLKNKFKCEETYCSLKFSGSFQGGLNGVEQDLIPIYKPLVLQGIGFEVNPGGIAGLGLQDVCKKTLWLRWGG
jgi:hypothetical protein